MCRQIPDLLPSYARRIEPQLAAAPITSADLAAHPHVVSLHLVYSCQAQAVATVTYRLDHRLLELDADLVHEPDGWQVFDVPELAGPALLPAPLQAGKRLC